MTALRLSDADRQTIEEALRLLIIKSGSALRPATKAMASLHANSPVLAVAVRIAVDAGVGDPQNTLTAEDKRLIGEALLLSEGKPSLTVDIRLRVSPEEKEQVQQRAEAAGASSVSNYLRRLLRLDEV